MDGQLDSKWFDPVSEKYLPGYGHLPKMELITGAVCSLYNQNHRSYERQAWRLPTGETEWSMGQNFHMRSFTVHNSFDYLSDNVVYGVNFGAFPRARTGNRDPLQGWVSENFDSILLAFPRIPHRELTMLTVGSYHIKIGPQYLTDLRYYEVQELINQFQMHDFIDWDWYDTLMSVLPDETVVWYYDQMIQPQNWNVARHGQWFARRLVLLKIPGRHSSNTSHKVVLAFIPNDWNLPSNFENKYGFHQQGLDRLVEYACVDRACPVGFRTNSCCAHVCAAVMFLGLYAHDHTTVQSVRKPLHWLDIKHPRGLNRDMLPG